MTAENSNYVLSTSNKRQALTCTSCLQIFRDPRILPCSHTFCKKCLDDLIQHHPDESFPCPTCGKRIKISAEGSSDFRSDFSIDEEELDRARNATTCSVHLHKQLDMFCLECDLCVCVDCKLTSHLHHRTQTLQDESRDADLQLLGEKARLSQAEDKIQKMVEKHQTIMDRFEHRRVAIELTMQRHHAALVTEADKYLKKTLNFLQDTCTAAETWLLKDLHTFSETVPKLDKLEQKIDRVLQDGDSCTIVNTATDVRRECKSIENRKKTEFLPLQSVSWLFHEAETTEDEAMFLSMRNFIRQRQQMRTVYTHTEVRVTEEVCCGEDDDSVVFFVCPGDKYILVSFESSCKEKPLFNKLLTYRGMWNQKTLIGRCGSFRDRGADDHLCIHFSKTGSVNTFVKRGDPERHYKLKTSPSSPVGCVSFDTVVCDKPLKTEATYLFSIDCGPHRAVDTNSAADLFAVVEEPRTPGQASSRTVRLFRRDQSAAIATYQSPLTPCQPADVCFFRMAGQEVLLIADELNNTIHVVEVKDGCMTFSHFLPSACPLLVQPTALNIDPKGRLWVGCKGGRLLTVQLTIPRNDIDGDGDDGDDGDGGAGDGDGADDVAGDDCSDSCSCGGGADDCGGGVVMVPRMMSLAQILVPSSKVEE